MRIDSLQVSAFTIPTEEPESDGTLEWDSTTLVLVEARAAEKVGIGYTYASPASALLVRNKLAEAVVGSSAMDISRNWHAMIARVRNLGHTGPSATAISAVDNALWDLKAKLLDLPLVSLMGAVRDAMPIYGSGGFTSYSDEKLARQLAGWVEEGTPRVKMKVGRDPARDPHRLEVTRKAIGDQTELFVDANSAYDRKQALTEIECFVTDFDVRWMEQPLPPEDRDGMRFLRDRSPASIDITDGEYSYDLAATRDLLLFGTVDVVMADATRCGGITGFLKAAALCDAWRMPISSHCAPLQHLPIGCCVAAYRHGEYFHDHVRIERMLFDGMPDPHDGALRPDLSRPGLGVEFRHADAERFKQSI